MYVNFFNLKVFKGRNSTLAEQSFKDASYLKIYGQVVLNNLVNFKLLVNTVIFTYCEISLSYKNFI